MKITILSGNDESKKLDRKKILQPTEHQTVEDEGQKLVMLVQTPSIFAEQKIIWIDNFEKISKENLEKLLKTNITTTEILSSVTKPPKIKNPDLIIETYKIEEKSIKQTIRQELSEAKITLNNQTLNYLYSRTEKIEKVRNLIKLINTAGLTNPTKAHIDILLGSGEKEPGTFEFKNQIETNDKQAIVTLTQTDEIRAANILTKHLRDLALVKELADNEQNAADALKMHAYPAKKIFNKAKNKNQKVLHETYENSIPLDKKVKHSKTKKALIEQTIIEIQS